MPDAAIPLESEDPLTTDPSRRQWWIVATIAAGAWAYLVGCVASMVLLWGLADRWWPSTVLQYAPRWPILLPLVVLFPAALLICRRSIVVLLASSLIGVGPVTGFRVPWSRIWQQEPSGRIVRVVSLNVGGGFDARAFATMVADFQPDIIAFQDWRREAEVKRTLGADWHIQSDLARMGLASRFPIRGRKVVARGRKGGSGPIAVRYELETPDGTLHFLNVHPITPRDGLQSVIALWWHGADRLRANTEQRRDESATAAALVEKVPGPVLVAGDFNMPIESAIYRRYWSRYTNAFSTAGFGFGYTFGRNKRLRKWVRIDHILSDVHWRIRRCRVGPYVGSDHWPVLAELELRGGAD